MDKPSNAEDEDNRVSNLNSMLFPSQLGEDSPTLQADDRMGDQVKKLTIFDPAYDAQDGGSKFDEPFQNQFEDNGPDGSSFDSALYSIEEAKLLCQRNRHYCSESLMKKFKRLVRADCAELYFTPLIML